MVGDSMITKEFMDYFVKKFKQSFELENKWNKLLFSSGDKKDWPELFYNRSKEYRDAFQSNEEILAELKMNIHDDLSKEEASILYDAFFELYYGDCDDYVVLSIILDPLTNYYRKVSNLDKLIPLLHAYAYEESEFYLTVNNTHNTDALKYYFEIFNYQDKYATLKSRDARLAIFKGYSNLLVSMEDLITTDIMQYFQVRQRALGLWYSNIVQSIDGNDSDFHYYIDRIASDVFKVCNLDLLSEKDIQVIKITYEKYTKNRKVRSNIQYSEIVKLQLDYYDGLITPEELYNSLKKIHNDNIDKVNFEGDDATYIENADIAIKHIISLYKKGKLSNELKEDALNQIYRYKTFLASIPYKFNPNEINHLALEFYQTSHDLLKSFNDKVDFILEVILFRQPVTCIHSLMVQKISDILTNAIFDAKPELFIGLLNHNNLEDVLKNRNSIIEYITMASLLHDVGKIICANVINTQLRRLDDKEFKIIKIHPKAGKKVLCNDKDFKTFYDVMEGHHKFYDGSFGYPAEVENTKSKYRIATDIVTICDSIDAATDILGRNYAKGKSFIELLEELKKDSGTRYNPDIVNIIDNDMKLINDLSFITKDGRLDVYEYVYNKFIKE